MPLDNVAGEPAARSDTRIAEIAMDPAKAAALERAQQRSTLYWVGIIAILVLLSEQTLFGILLITPILPSIALTYHTTEIAWVVTLFSLVGAALSPLLGKLADLYGKKRMLSMVALVAGIGSLISAVSPSFGVLLAGRALAGLGMVFLPLAYMLMRDTFPKRLLPMAIAVATSGSGIATLIGPYTAGQMAEHLGVRSVFWLVTVITVAGGLLTWLLVPESPVRTRERLDWLGALLLTAGVGGILYAVSQSSAWGWGSPRTAGLLAGSVLLLALWFWWQTRCSHPLIGLRLLRSRPVLTVITAAALATMVNAVVGSLAPTLLQTPDSKFGTGLGLSPSTAALYIMPAGAAIVLSGFIVGWTGRRVGFRNYVVAGATLVGVCSVVLAFNHSTVLAICLLQIPIGLGLAHAAASSNLIVLAVPPDQGAVASGTNATISSLVSAIVIQVCFVILGGHVVAVVGFEPVYSSGAWTAVFLIGGAFSLVGAVVALAIPHGRAVRQAKEARPAEAVSSAGG